MREHKMNTNTTPPFTQEYVLELTHKQIQQVLKRSWDKTMNRLDDFTDDPEKTQEIKDTLFYLQGLLDHINGFGAYGDTDELD